MIFEKNDMSLEDFLRTHTEQKVVYRYLDMLAERTVALERRLGLDELAALKRENQQLRTRLAQCTSPDLESLLVYLPIIFRRFWASVQPAELALLAGCLDVPHIPSPYPEPSADTIQAMKQRFLSLPRSDQQRLADFCRQLPYKLDVRPEMRGVLEQCDE